jgi:nicotinate-nucleotide pyrophosphorylase (carboxylating)
MHLNPLMIEDAVKAALKEDLGHGFDITSDLLIPASATARGVLRAREAGKLAGLIVALSTFSILDGDFEMSVNVSDGEDMKAGKVIAEIEGPARAMLTAERVALNFLNHMSGVATMTAEFVREIKGTGAEICDTRKTLPGLRLFQKYAVYIGGGSNHRFGLDDAVLIKDNHIAVAGSIGGAIDQVRMLAGHTKKIEIEVDSIKQLEEVLEHGGADIVMLDNFTPANLKKAVKLAKGHVTLEASGGVSLENVKEIAKTGVDYISVGALTHSAPQLDIGLDIKI